MEDKILSQEDFLTILVEDVARSPLIERQFKERCAGIDTLKAHDSALRAALATAQEEVSESYSKLQEDRLAAQQKIEALTADLAASCKQWESEHAIAVKLVDELTAEREKSRDAAKGMLALVDNQRQTLQVREQQFGNLLAVMHGDGGHYLDEHGWEKAGTDAEAKYCDQYLKREKD